TSTDGDARRRRPPDARLGASAWSGVESRARVPRRESAALVRRPLFRARARPRDGRSRGLAWAEALIARRAISPRVCPCPELPSTGSSVARRSKLRGPEARPELRISSRSRYLSLNAISPGV